MRFVSLLGACLLAGSATAGQIEGKVQLVEKRGQTARDASEVVVYLEDAKAPPGRSEATVKMHRKAFQPRVVVIPVGGTVHFPNEDAIFHNVFSVTAPNRFDLDLYKKPKSASWTFEHPGIVKIYCNIHPQMSGVVVVRDNPYYTMAERDGSFRITGVPAGTWVLKAWHERTGEVTEQVTVPAEGTAEVSMVLDGSSYKRSDHLNKHGKPYRRRY